MLTIKRFGAFTLEKGLACKNGIGTDCAVCTIRTNRNTLDQMAISQKLDMRVAQQQTMTPLLQQAIEMLQMNNLELAAFVEQQLEQNPLLEKLDQDAEIILDNNLTALAENPLSQENGEAAPADSAESPADIPDSHEMGAQKTEGSDQPLDTEYDNYWQDAANDGAYTQNNLSNWENKPGGHNSQDTDFTEHTASETNLRDYLLAQAAVELPDPGDRIIASFLVDMLDDAGYFRGDIDAVAQALECTAERVTFTLLRLQHLEPAGIFARNLAECLALQLREKNRLDPVMQKFLNHLDLLGQHKMAELQKICGVDTEDLRDMVDEIKTLNPKPGEAFRKERADTLIPDIFLRPQKGGGWQIELNNETLPRVLLNNRYYAQIKKDVKQKEDRKYISEKYQMANWLIKAMSQRAETILKTASEIVRQQDGFFQYGVEYLRPLTRRDIAEAVGMHESTISRVTTGKYIATPRGIFELRYFFSSSIASSDGGMEHSSESIRHKIKNAIQQEPKEKPLSDDKIVQILEQDGVHVARRTVAKYREQLQIPSSSERKRLKSI